jgi:hypothetical protein
MRNAYRASPHSAAAASNWPFDTTNNILRAFTTDSIRGSQASSEVAKKRNIVDCKEGIGSSDDNELTPTEAGDVAASWRRANASDCLGHAIMPN